MVAMKKRGTKTTRLKRGQRIEIIPPDGEPIVVILSRASKAAITIDASCDVKINPETETPPCFSET
ncbi:hypothetical protein Pan216_21100 [Planctomycetes bacterium Pan216]|uniref:Uncharacterized protein n=1 Tax=Kolteria novifilia TaxID=2527975 RepID=A0A518B2U5_9BACT|nr:hypothetical protein Pan216_21100 [Planctomycetes bacterium Pan216]